MPGLLDSWFEQLMQGQSRQPVGILGDFGVAAQGGPGAPQMMPSMDRSIGPIPEMGNLNMRPDMLQLMQRQPGLAQMLLGMMSPQGQQVPPMGQGAPQSSFGAQMPQAMYGGR